MHNTFRRDNQSVPVKDGTAALVLGPVYDAFTVGVEADSGATKLELDLATLTNAPKEFLSN